MVSSCWLLQGPLQQLLKARIPSQHAISTLEHALKGHVSPGI